MSLLFPAQTMAQILYWDTNSNAPGAGTNPSDTWSTSPSQKNWDPNSAGTTFKERWTDGRDAVFSAGNDATGAYTVTVSNTVSVSSITIEEGTPTFTGGTINFSDATPDFNVGSGLTTTVNSDISGTNGLTKTGAGTLVLDTSDKTYTGTTTINTGTLDLAFNQSFGTIDLSGGTLKLSSASTNITSLNVTAHSTIDFGGANAALNISNLNITTGMILTIINWTAAADFFYATTWAGAIPDLPNNGNTAPMNQVVFSGFGADQTGWDSFDNQIRPNVPEPSTYGVLLMTIMSGLAWARKRFSRRAA